MVPERIRRRRVFWNGIEAGLQGYTKGWSLHLWLGFGSREGAFLVASLIALVGLAWIATRELLSSEHFARGLLAIPAVVYVVDSFLVNTSITFVTRAPIHSLRSKMLTLLNVLNVGCAFAVIYAAQRYCFKSTLGFIDGLYFSFVTLTTLGYGDIHPGGPCARASQITVVLELIAGLYFIVVVLANVVSWAPGSGEHFRNSEGEP